MMRRNLALALAGCALALAESCVSPEELRREDESRCAGYGFQTGTREFANCLQQENLARLYTAPPPAPYWGIGAAFWDRAVAITITTITIGWLMAIGPINIKRASLRDCASKALPDALSRLDPSPRTLHLCKQIRSDRINGAPEPLSPWHRADCAAGD